MREKVVQFLFAKPKSEVEIVSGGARGADRLGELFSKYYNLKLTVMSADWDTYGKAAGYRRNAEMAKYADGCIVFMKKEGSRGSQHMINLAKENGLDLEVVLY